MIRKLTLEFGNGSPHELCICVYVCFYFYVYASMHFSGMHICRPVLLCSSSLIHTSVISLQLVALLSKLKHLVCWCCVCAQPGSLQLKSQQAGILSAGLRGSGVALAAIQSHVSFSKRCLCVHPCIIPTAHYPCLGLLRLPLVCLARSVQYVCVCVFSKMRF